jgi:pseudouridine synthase
MPAAYYCGGLFLVARAVVPYGTDMERIQKRIARSGYCSRRSAEALVADGRVTVNGQLAHIGQHVAVDDEIRIDGAMLGGEPAPVYLKVNKPVGYVCSHRSQGGAPTVFDLVDHDTRLTAVGRLDKDSRGLVVLTNDGELVNQLTHPSFAHEKAYEVTVSGIADLAAASSALQRGVSISSSERVRAAKVDVLNDDTLAIVLRQGKNRQIRRMIAALGGCVDDLVRVRIATLELGSLAEGEWASIAPVAIEQLRMSSTVRIDSEYGPVHR